MTTQQLEEVTRPLENRIATLESEITQIKELIQLSQPSWTSVFGSFADCAEFDEMEAFGQSWRAAQNQAPDFESSCTCSIPTT
jgi:hypothetical protein